MSEHRQLTGIREEDRNDHPNRRGLAGSVRADEAIQSATRDDEVEFADRCRLTECLGYPFQEDRCVHGSTPQVGGYITCGAALYGCEPRQLVLSLLNTRS